MKKNRRGSAILIVLGMLSFMVVSAVGFSIYMRTSRMPSSYLRRNVAARYLVRSALAKAIEDLEGDLNTDPDWGKADDTDPDVPTRFYGIYDDPYPGVVVGGSNEKADSSGRQNGDYWLGRVFMPFGPVSGVDATVPTLTLEALAYLPPAIIDDVRRLSRLTRTASWRPFPYDSGRYAYCAVNVSDMFDINRLRASVPRNSGPDRVTLASLCAKSADNPTDLDQAAAKRLDAILDKTETVGNLNGNPVPFTSLADFNLVAGQGSDYAPFMDFVGTTAAGPLGSKSASSQTANSMFITDTWFPPTNAVGGEAVLDLSSGAQPFLNYNADNVGEIGTSGRGVLSTIGQDIYVKNLGTGIACLYDYLDSDNIPCSLALPTTEAVPMVVGISAPGPITPDFGTVGTETITLQGIRGTAVADGDDTNTQVPLNSLTVTRTITTLGVTGFGNNANVKVVVAYPFKRLSRERRTKSYRVRGLLRVWLAPQGMRSRPNGALAEDILYPSQLNYNAWDDANSGKARNGVVTFLSTPVALSIGGDDMKKAEDAVDEVQLTFSSLGDTKMPVYCQVTETPGAPQGYHNPVADPSNYNGQPYFTFGNLVDNDSTLRPLTVDGDIDGDWKNAADAANESFDKNVPYNPGNAAGVEFDKTAAFAQREHRLHAAVWIQVLDGNQVVDMAPATLTDDVEWLNANSTILKLTPIATRTGLRDGTPILNFMGSRTVKYADIDTTLAGAITYDGWKSVYAVDPRYNFAPEDWFSAPDAASKSAWMQLIGLDGSSSPILGKDGRDRDIFMFVSDQEYLQSIGELQFLPILDEMDGTAKFDGRYAPDFHGKPLSERTGPTTGDFANGGRFWRTYTAYDNGDDRPAGEGAPEGTFNINPYYMKYNGKRVTVLSDTGGFKLNPFSDDDRVITAALIGTPFDYYVASTNSNQSVNRNTLVGTEYGGTVDLAQMMNRFSFGENNDIAKLSNDYLYDIAGAIKDKFRERAADGKREWLPAWDSLMWQDLSWERINENNTPFMEDKEGVITLDAPLHGVDRKFLYSFWRDCFDNRQQLFLIFVRAEPTSVGGGSIGARSSSQLGARAVALVWRDPAIPEKNAGQRGNRSMLNNTGNLLKTREMCPPHRTRVLFYHQFE